MQDPVSLSSLQVKEIANDQQDRRNISEIDIRAQQRSLMPVHPPFSASRFSPEVGDTNSPKSIVDMST